ncbi:MAG: SPOR domain-containing protein, partial [Rhodothermales bacterium]|nr:SPOR domain-containing protein [Rhodothermales bacterium]
DDATDDDVESEARLAHQAAIDHDEFPVTTEAAVGDEPVSVPAGTVDDEGVVEADHPSAVASDSTFDPDEAPTEDQGEEAVASAMTSHVGDQADADAAVATLATGTDTTTGATADTTDATDTDTSAATDVDTSAATDEDTSVATDADATAVDAAATVTDTAHDAETSSTTDEGSAEPKAPATPASDKPPVVVKRQSRALPYFALIVVPLLAIAGVLYVISRGDGFPPQPEEVIDDSQDGEGAESAAQAPPAVFWEPGAIDRRAGGYTLIVSSQPTIEEASAVALELAHTLGAEGLPIDVLRGTARGETWYRVAIGQFSRQSVATQELRRLAEKLPEGAWVLRIRTNM